VIELLALDVDGTVIRRDGTIAPEDLAAAARARRHGITVILATGRILSGTLPVARELGLDAEIISAGGASITHSATGEVIESHPMTSTEVDDLLEDLDPLAAPFLLSNETVHHDARGEPYLDYLRVWSPRLRAHPRLSAGWPGESILAAIVLGPCDVIGRAEEGVRRRSGGRLMTFSFPAHQPGGRGQHVVLVRRARTKGDGLRAVARRRGLARHQLAAVGDWLNDVPMFQAVGRSFVMGQAGDDVARHATDRLEATDRKSVV
jgi:hydroxymethylpyrimidine pyrophosphatase-like HAD family hydrolase